MSNRRFAFIIAFLALSLAANVVGTRVPSGFFGNIITLTLSIVFAVGTYFVSLFIINSIRKNK
jgi:hypothetical protein